MKKKISHKIRKFIINSKIQKLIDRATYLDIDFDAFLKKYVTPKLVTEDGSEVSFNFKKSHQIGCYLICTGLAGSYLVGEVLRDMPVYIPFGKMPIWEKECLINVLKEEGFFNE